MNRNLQDFEAWVKTQVMINEMALKESQAAPRGGPGRGQRKQPFSAQCFEIDIDS